MKLGAKLLLTFTALALLPLAAFGGLYQAELRGQVRRTAQEHLEAVADLADRRIEGVLDDGVERVQQLASQRSLRAPLQAFLQNGTSAERAQLRQALAEALPAFPEVRSLAVALPSGTVVAATEPALEGLDVSATLPFQEGREGPSARQLRTEPDGAEVLDIAVPVRSGSGADAAVLGVVLAEASAEPIAAITRDHTGLGQTGEVALARRGDGGAVHFLFPLRFDDPGAALRVVQGDSDLAAAQAIAGREGPLGEVRDYRGEPVLASVRRIDPAGWALVAKVDAGEADAPLAALLRFLGGTLLVLSAAVVLASLALSRSLSRPLHRLSREARRVAAAQGGRAVPGGRDEVRDLEASFAAMTAALLESQRGLADKVGQRTRELERSERRTAAIVETAKEAIVTADDQGLILSANRATRDVFGQDPAALVGRPLTVLMPPGLRAAHLAGLRRYLDTREARVVGRTAELRGLRADGSEFPLELSLAAWESEGRTYFSGILRDISQRKADAAVLEKARLEAESASRAKSEFLANMSHEIRTPLNAVIGLGAILEETKLDPDQREMLRTIRTSSSHLLGLLNDILDLSKIEAGRLEMESRPFPLRRPVEDALDVVAPAARGKGLELTWSIAPGVPEGVLGDAGRLRQVLVNLLGNAVKFTPKGSVRLAVEGAPGDVRIRVADTGIGMEREQVGRLFAPFTQADASIARRFGGTGLGLAICARLVALMGGRIDVESELGKGSTFTARLPLPAAAVPAPEGQGLAPFAGRAIAILASDPQERLLLEEHLRAWGLDPVAAAPGERPPRAAGAALAVVADDAAGPAGPAVRVPALFVGSPEAAAAARERGLDVRSRVGRPLRLSALHDALVDLAGSQPPPAPGRRLRILVAEDHPVNQKVIQRMLGRAGQGADVAADGLEAVERARTGGYDLVFMDVQMPRLDGLEATRRIRALPIAQPLIVGTTAHAGLDDHRRCLDAGMDDVLTKPLPLKGLEKALRQAMER